MTLLQIPSWLCNHHLGGLPAAFPTLCIPPRLPLGALLGGYETLRFKSKKSPTASRLETLHVLLPGAVPEQMATKARAVASGAMLTRCGLDDQGGRFRSRWPPRHGPWRAEPCSPDGASCNVYEEQSPSYSLTFPCPVSPAGILSRPPPMCARLRTWPRRLTTSLSASLRP